MNDVHVASSRQNTASPGSNSPDYTIPNAEPIVDDNNDVAELTVQFTTCIKLKF